MIPPTEMRTARYALALASMFVYTRSLQMQAITTISLITDRDTSLHNCSSGNSAVAAAECELLPDRKCICLTLSNDQVPISSVEQTIHKPSSHHYRHHRQKHWDIPGHGPCFVVTSSRCQCFSAAKRLGAIDEASVSLAIFPSARHISRPAGTGMQSSA